MEIDQIDALVKAPSLLNARRQRQFPAGGFHPPNITPSKCHLLNLSLRFPQSSDFDALELPYTHPVSWAGEGFFRQS